MNDGAIADLESKMEADFTRQRDSLDPSKHRILITSIGCGGIGGPTALLLSKAGAESITLIDPDSVELHNIPNQMFRKADVDRPKVDALSDLLTDQGYAKVYPIENKFENVPNQLSNIIVSGLDSMGARQELWKLIKSPAIKQRVTLLLDGRIGGNDIVLLTIDPSNEQQVKMYEKDFLFSDEEGVEAPCTDRGRIDLGFAVGAEVITNLILHFKGEEVPAVVTKNVRNRGISVF